MYSSPFPKWHCHHPPPRLCEINRPREGKVTFPKPTDLTDRSIDSDKASTNKTKITFDISCENTPSPTSVLCTIPMCDTIPSQSAMLAAFPQPNGTCGHQGIIYKSGGDKTNTAIAIAPSTGYYRTTAKDRRTMHLPGKTSGCVIPQRGHDTVPRTTTQTNVLGGRSLSLPPHRNASYHTVPPP